MAYPEDRVEVDRLDTRCESCHRPLPGVEAPVYCSACELPCLRARVVELQYLVAALLLDRRGRGVAIDERVIERLKPESMLSVWRDEATRTLNVQLRH